MDDKDKKIIELERTLDEELGVKRSEVMRNKDLLEQNELLKHNIEKLLKLQEEQAKEIAKLKYLIKKRALED
jgi:hypothetical protein|tara:strand:- start:597 stop:812 length:216 start_codon:yes stop_codon:yes gene_type:complete